jgi:hypothetical protein
MLYHIIYLQYLYNKISREIIFTVNGWSVMASLVDEWFSKYLLFHLFFFLSRCLDWMMVVMGQKSIIFHRQQQKREEYSAVYCTWFTILRLSRSPSAFSFSHRYSYFYLLLHLMAISVIFFKDENNFLWAFFFGRH